MEKIFHITGPLWGETAGYLMDSTGHLVDSPHKGPVSGGFPSQMASEVGLWYIVVLSLNEVFSKRKLALIWDVMTLLWETP